MSFAPGFSICPPPCSLNLETYTLKEGVWHIPSQPWKASARILPSGSWTLTLQKASHRVMQEQLNSTYCDKWLGNRNQGRSAPHHTLTGKKGQGAGRKQAKLPAQLFPYWDKMPRLQKGRQEGDRVGFYRCEIRFSSLIQWCGSQSKGSMKTQLLNITNVY